MSKNRTRECKHGHRFTTVEVHTTVAVRAVDRMRQFEVTTQTRRNQRDRDKSIALALHDGWRPLAEKYGLTKSAVYYAAKMGRKALREESK